MDMDEIRTILSNSRVDVWTLMDAAIALASSEYGDELKHRRDGIVERLYASPAVCRNCDGNLLLRQQNEAEITKASIERENSHEGKVRHSPYTPQSIQREDDDDDEEPDPYGGLFDDEQTKILKIKEQLEDPEQVSLCFFLNFKFV